MSVIITSSKYLDVKWANELLLLKPAHPLMSEQELPIGPHVKNVITLYFEGYKPGSNLKKDSPWMISVIQRGYVKRETVELDYAYESLCSKNSVPNSSLGFYNDILNLPSDKRMIRPSSLEGSVSLSLKESGTDHVPSPKDIPAIKLHFGAKKRDGSIVLTAKQGYPYSKFDILGSGEEPQIMRFSYISDVALDKGSLRGLFMSASCPGQKFYTHETFRIETPQLVEDEIKRQVNSLGKDEIKGFGQVLNHKIKNLIQDLTVVGDPTAFDYRISAGSTRFIEQQLDRIAWRNPADTPQPNTTLVYSVFPKGDLYGEKFTMDITARLLCDVCFPYVIEDKVKDLVSKELKEHGYKPSE
jgi:hypothetical protein